MGFLLLEHHHEVAVVDLVAVADDLEPEVEQKLGRAPWA
jgi:hypothetical protein